MSTVNRQTASFAERQGLGGRRSGAGRQRSAAEVREVLAALSSGGLLSRLQSMHQAQVRSGFFALLQAGFPQQQGGASSYNVVTVDADAVSPNRYRPPVVVEEKELDRLAQNIREHGILEPIHVMVDPQASPGDPPRYWVISGERRRQAAIRAGITRLPVLIREVAPRAALQMLLSEMLQTESMSVLDRARIYATLTAEMGMTTQELAATLGIAAEEIELEVALLSLEAPILESLSQGHLQTAQAKVLLRAPSPTARMALWQHARRYRSSPERLAERLAAMLTAQS